LLITSQLSLLGNRTQSHFISTRPANYVVWSAKGLGPLIVDQQAVRVWNCGGWVYPAGAAGLG
jgi:hypothetical protein